MNNFENTIGIVIIGYGFSLGILTWIYLLLQRQIRITYLAQAELQQRSLMLDLANDAIIIRTFEGKINYWNQGAEKLYGWTKAEAIDKYTHELLQTVFPTSIELVIDECLHQGCWEGELIHTKRHGIKITVASRWTLQRDAQGNPLSLLEINNDISDRKQTELNLKRLNEELESRVQQRTSELSAALAKLNSKIIENEVSLAALSQSQRRYASLTEASPVGIFCADIQGNCVYINDRGCAMLGLTATEAMGDGWARNLHPDDRERVLQTWANFTPDNSPLYLEYRFQNPSGVITWVFVQIVSEIDHITGITNYIGTITDISDRKRAEQALQLSEQLYRTIIHNFPNGAVVLFDHDLRYLLADGTGLKKLGMSKERLEGKTIWEVLPLSQIQLLEPIYKSVLAGNTQIKEIVYNDYIYRVHYLPLKDEQGKIFAGLAMSQDITLYKQAEKILLGAREQLEIEIQQRTQELIAANLTLQSEISERVEAEAQLQLLTIDLQRSNQELEQFAYIASHDLQEPLRAITSYTQLLAQRYQQQLDAKADKYIYYIVDGAARMQQLIQDLLAYSRVGRSELNLQLTDFNVIIEQVIRNLQVAIAESSCKITVDVLPTIAADSLQIIQLFQNLLSNAIKYRSQVPPEINISVSQKNEQWIFAIRDNGIGIELQYKDRIFVLFQRLHTRKEYTGTGIGLALCKKIVERHNGKIWFDSELGKGSTFYITLPMTQNHPS